MQRVLAAAIALLLTCPLVCAQKLYWLKQEGCCGRIQRSNLDGSNIEDLVVATQGTLRYLEIDRSQRMLYWTNLSGGIFRANLDLPNGQTASTRTDIETLVPVVGSPAALHCDFERGKMYWWNTNNKIWRANLDGTAVEELVTGLTNIRHIDLDFPASALARTGGANPGSYTASPVVLGATWTADVDLSLTGHTHAQILAYDNPASITLAGGQVVLVGGTKLFSLPLMADPASWSVSIPNDSSIVGITLYTQAAHLFGVTPFALSNAQDLFVGY